MDLPNIKSYQLKDIFPVQKKQTEAQLTTHDYLNIVHNYVLNVKKSKHILQDQDLSFIEEHKHLLEQYKFLFFQSYACVLLFSRRQPFMPTNIGILYFKKLNTNIYTDVNQCCHFVEEPQQIGVYQIEVLSHSDTTLEDEVNHFKSQIQISLGKLDKGQMNEKAPYFLKLIVEHTLKSMQSPPKPVQKPNIFQGKEAEKALPIKFLKQDTINFHNLSFPELQHQYCYLIFSYIFGNQKLVRILLLSFKMHILNSEINKNDPKVKLDDLKICLNQLIKKFKILYNKEIPMNKDEAFALFKEMNKNIENIYLSLNEKTYSITSHSLYESLLAQKEFEHPQSIQQIVEYSNFAATKLSNANSIGFVQNLTFSLQTPFTQLKALSQTLSSQQNGQYYWILLVQKCIFGLSSNLQNSKVNPTESHIFQRVQTSVMHQIVTQYQQIMTNPELKGEYSLKLKNQAYSHVYLIKYIAAALAFQLCKKNTGNIFDLNGHTIQLDIKALYTNFTSLSFEAREAMLNLEKYITKNNQKPILFSLNCNNQNLELKKMAKAYCLLAQQKGYIDQKKSRIEGEIKKLESSFAAFVQRHKSITNKLQTLKDQQCTCRYTEPKLYYQKSTLIQCIRCKNISIVQQSVREMQGQTFLQILAEIPKEENDLYLFVFFEQMKRQTGGTMKLIYQAQMPIVKKQVFSNQSNNMLGSLEQLNPFSQRKYSNRKNYYQNIILMKNKASQFVVYQEPLVIYYYAYSRAQPIDFKFLEPEANPIYANLQWMIQPDSKNKKRQHMVYANLDKKQSSKIKEFNSISMEQFKQYASIRVSYRTELIMLAQAILSRSAAPTTIKLHEFQRLIIMNACGNINAFRAYQENYDYIFSNNAAPVLEENELPIIRESIQHLLQNYLSQWKFNDIYCLEIIGIILSLLSKLINTPHLVIRIAARAFQQYQVLKRENANKVNTQAKLRELYILHSIMSCFSENLCEQSGEACILFGKIMVNYRLNKRYLHAQHFGNKQYSANVKKYKNYFNHAVLNNIHSVIKYFLQRPEDIVDVIKQVDQDITKNCQWQFINNFNYVFKGTSIENIYQINFFQGIILKNGAQTSKLPQLIKENPHYEQIFGKYTDLEVFQQRNGLMRTRSDFHNHFKQQLETQVFFEFSISNKQEVQIRLIFKKENQTQRFLLIPHSILNKEQIYVPELYLKQYQCWMDESNHHLIFRKRNLETMNKIGLILMQKILPMSQYDQLESVVTQIDIEQIHQGRIITKQFQQEPLSYLIDEEHQNYFEKLVITSKLHYKNKAVEILSSIENPEYIIQTYSSGFEKRTIFWLHRCDLKFLFDENKGLVSLNLQGYSVPNEYRHHDLLPWRRKDDVKCLILHKHEKSFRSVIMHEYIFLLSNQVVSKRGHITIMPGEAAKNEIMDYQLHDTFMDIRSKSRVTQLHLICMIASLSSCMQFKPLMMTNEEYCINLIRSCYSNIPLNVFECAKVLNLISLCVELNLNTLLLCCVVLCKITCSLKDVLAYQQIQQAIDSKLMPYLSQKEGLIKTCKIIYRKRYQEEMISPHGELNRTELLLLGISQDRLIEMNKKLKLTKWFQKQSYTPQFDEKTKKGFDTASQSYYKSQNDIKLLRKSIMNFFQKENNKNSPEKEYKLRLQQHDILAKEMLDDMESSYKSYLRYNEQYEKLELTKQDSIKNLIRSFTLPKQKCEKIKKDLSKYLEKVTEKAGEHLDFIVGHKSIITVKFYTELLCNPELIQEFYCISKQNSDIIIKGIREWILLTLQIESLTRVLIILGEKPLDKIALFRQLQSPRTEINEKNYWICFEAEMKIRIWRSQYDTYKHLRDSESGSVSQLNMGEGKTQVIIPMIVLDNIYDESFKNPISRINILSQLFQQAQGNYFRFFSATSFRIPIFSLYFNREITLTRQNIHRIKFMIYILRQKLLMLLDRQSCLSMILKIRQDVLSEQSFITNIGEYRDQWLLDKSETYDIFDQVDALMTCKKSFVYSIGPSSELPDSRLRFQLARLIIEIISIELFDWLLDTKMAIIEQTREKAWESIRKGGFPRGLRLKKDLDPKMLIQFRYRIVEILLHNENYCPPEFQFYSRLNQTSKKLLIDFLIDQTADHLSQLANDIPKDINQILAVRGLIAFRVLQHCLTMRNGVDFGVPGEIHPKSVGVPYDAGDVPSKRSEFSHPDVAILVSYISYFAKGITLDQFSDCIHLLMKKSESVKHTNYELWFKIINDLQFKPTKISQFKQINIDSNQQIEYLYQKYKYNRNTIVYWLINIVFIKDLRQYASSITSSCWDISYVKKSIGFSGTKDTRWLFPNYLKWSPSSNDTINGTDGKMVHQMLRCTRGILVIKDGKQSLWERFCQHILQLQDKQIGSIIDAGAILVGKSFEKQIVPWIVKNPYFKKHKFRGITFCDEYGKWKVFDTVTLSVVERGTSIPEHETFVIFDEARTRGADIKMGSQIVAVLSLSPNMTKDKLMQAVGRLRKFGRHQQIYIMGTSEVFEKIKGLEKARSLKERVEKVIEWACENSINQNRSMQYANSRLAQIHYKTVLQRNPDVQVFDSSLKSLYSGKITEKTVYDIYTVSISAKFSPETLKSKQIEALTEKIKAYGCEYKMKSYDFEDVCERQVQFVVETEKILENEYDQLIPIDQSNTIQYFNGTISTLQFKFDTNLKFSKNFINCTKSNSINQKSLGLFGNANPISKKENEDNQLSNIYFFLWEDEKFVIITQREMTLQLEKGTQNFGFYSLGQFTDYSERFVGRFRDLNKMLPIIENNGLERTLTHAQFFNGYQFFDNQGRRILIDLVKDYLKKSQKASNPPANSQSFFSTNSFLNQINNLNVSNSMLSQPQVVNNTVDLEQILSHFLNRRRTVQSKFLNSDLEKVVIQLKNITARELFE